MLRHLTRVTAPAAPLISLTEAKLHLRVTHARDDQLISSLAAAAEAYLDGPSGALGRAIQPQTWRLTLSEFPACSLTLPLPPFGSLTSFEYDDAASVTHSVDATTYTVRTHRGAGVLTPKTFWPAAEAVRVTFQCGFALDAPERAPLRAAALLLLGGLYENRSSETPVTIQLTTNPALSRLLRPLGVAPWS